MDIGPTWPEWVHGQELACVFGRAPSPAAAIEIAAGHFGHLKGWEAGTDVGQEVFRWEEYRDHAGSDDYPRSVILASRS